MDKKMLSERDICTKFIAPAIAANGWGTDHQMRDEVSLTDGRDDVRDNKAHRDRNEIEKLLALTTPSKPASVPRKPNRRMWLIGEVV